MAWAYYNLGQAEEAQQLFTAILASPRLHPLDAEPIRRLLRRIEIEHGTAPASQSQEQMHPTSMWEDPTAARLLSPDPALGQTWVDKQSLQNMLQALSKREHSISAARFERFSAACWAEIRTARRYQVPSKGRAEILASHTLSDLIDLTLVTFVQEGADAPEVFLRFEFGEPPAIGVAKVKSDGTTEGFHEFAAPSVFRALIEATALAYYRDLVVPAKVPDYPSGDPAHHSQPSSATKPRKRPTSASAPVDRRQTYRPLPRLTGPSAPRRDPYQLEEWHRAQERARHGVVGHIRWVGPRFTPDSQKQRQALQAGVQLPPGYTWVGEHDRGGKTGYNGPQKPDTKTGQNKI